MSTFVGFGFGPIQAGLFLAEAHLSGNFDRLVVAEILPEVVEAVRSAGAYTVNIGYADHIAALTVAPVEIYAPLMAAERATLVAAVAEASEMATALPSVKVYSSGGADSVAAILADGLARKVEMGGPLAVIYAAENHTAAAALLEAAVLAAAPAALRDPIRRRVQFLDTIIGKMSGAPEESAGLAPLAPGLQSAFLVEAFNRILVSQIARSGRGQPDSMLDPAWAGYRRGIEVFVEKSDLTPFAEAKLYGHNAGHALAAYLAHVLGFSRIDQLGRRPDLLDFIERAMVDESGGALIARYAGFDPLFTPAGFAAYAHELIARMINPYVRDTVARVGRDPLRKLGWDDRLIGAMRLARRTGVTPWRYAWGVAAALDWLDVADGDTGAFLTTLWGMPAGDEEASAICALVRQAREDVGDWRQQGCPML